ncbi:MAG TPA: DNA polymerase III subunit delta [Acidimicrobiales bacterium]|nr:DNA polymerase III subunit delta [Acidimicrobiales bacterium]
MNAWYVKGDDEGLVRQRVSDLVAELTSDPFAVEDFGGEDYEVAAVLDACATPPFLGDRRVVVVRGVGRFRAEELAPLIGWLENPLETTSLVLVAGGGVVSQKLVNAVKKVGTVVDASAGTGKARTSWLVARLKDAPVKLDAAAGNLLSEHLGEDMGRVAGLLDALAASYGEGASVGVDELEPLLGQAGAVAPWDLTDAVDRGDTQAALSHLHRMMGAGERHPLVIMATLQRHYGSMLKVDGARVAGEKEAAELLGMAPFPAKKALTQARRLGWAGISRAVILLADADLALRGSAGWPEELVMDVLVARLSRLGPARSARASATAGSRR